MLEIAETHPIFAFCDKDSESQEQYKEACLFYYRDASYFRTFIANITEFSIKTFTFDVDLPKGVLAHPARALDWQSKGDRFESDILHKTQSNS